MNDTATPMARPVPVTLTGRVVQLEPLTLEHIPALAAAGADPRVWEWTLPDGHLPGVMAEYVRTALDDQAAGSALPFVVRHLADNQVIGSTRFANIAVEHGGLEIGWTWYHPSHWRTAVNTECKLLLLRHAFETLGAIRVELKTDAMNQRSRAAILRLGAVEEGILRSKMIVRNGRRRDTVYFSILDSEWSGVKAGLESRVAGRGS